MNPKRGLAIAATAVVIGAALLLLSASQVWEVQVQARPNPLPPVRVGRTGGSLEPAVPALGLVALAGAGGLIATRALARAIVGGLLAVAAVVEIVLLAGHLGASGWVWLGLVGALLVLGGAAATLWRGRGWPAMGSRYGRGDASGGAGAEVAQNDGEPAAGGASKGDVAMWDALDRGEDPTDGQGRPSRPT